MRNGWPLDLPGIFMDDFRILSSMVFVLFTAFTAFEGTGVKVNEHRRPGHVLALPFAFFTFSIIL